MAIMFPECIHCFDTPGEERVYNFLKNLPENYTIFYNIKSEITGLIDFIVVCPSGILGIEVKDWSTNYIKSSNTDSVTLLDRTEKKPSQVRNIEYGSS